MKNKTRIFIVSFLTIILSVFLSTVVFAAEAPPGVRIELPGDEPASPPGVTVTPAPDPDPDPDPEPDPEPEPEPEPEPLREPTPPPREPTPPPSTTETGPGILLYAALPALALLRRKK